MPDLFTSTIPTPLGPLRLVASDAAWIGAYLPAQRNAPPAEARPSSRTSEAVLARARAECDAYFHGDLRAFSTPLVLVGTPFQQAVWTALRQVGFGERCTYGDLARWLGRPSAARAVGAAVGRNPLSIVVPCHRVVGSNGALTGYAGGLAAKEWLLAHECAHAHRGAAPVDPTPRGPSAALDFAHGRSRAR